MRDIKQYENDRVKLPNSIYAAHNTNVSYINIHVNRLDAAKKMIKTKYNLYVKDREKAYKIINTFDPKMSKQVYEQAELPNNVKSYIDQILKA